MKKFIAAVLVVLLALSVLPYSVIADGAEEDRICEFSEDLADMADFSGPGEAASEFSTMRILIKSRRAPDDTDAVCTASYGSMFVYQYATEEAAEAALGRFALDENVEFAEADRVLSAAGHKSWGYAKNCINTDGYLSRIGGNIRYCQNVSVAVIDSGADLDHPFIADRIDRADAYDFVNNDSEPDDDNGHGTHVTGIICDGTPSNVSVIPLKAMDEYGETTEALLYLAIRYAIDKNADVINISAGGFGESSFFEEIIDEASAKGIIVVVAAGNEKTDASKSMPGNVASAVTVAAVDKNLTIAEYSNYGSIVDISAPGDDILSSVPPEIEDSDFVEYSGTSMAAPHVAAAAACLKMYDRSYDTDDVIKMFRSSARATTSPKSKPIGCGCVCLNGIPSDMAFDILLSHSKLNMYPGEVREITSSDTAAWTSSDGSVASVSDGVVTARGTGSADITATNAKGSATCAVTVTPLVFDMDETDGETYVGVDIVIPYHISHSCTVEWKSSDEKTATVDNLGHVTPKARGTVRITATAAAGTESETTHTVKIKISCPCLCHSTGFGAAIWKILRFFYKLFGTHKYCEYCGQAHY